MTVDKTELRAPIEATASFVPLSFGRDLSFGHVIRQKLREGQGQTPRELEAREVQRLIEQPPAETEQVLVYDPDHAEGMMEPGETPLLGL